MADAVVEATIELPDGVKQSLTFRHAPAATGPSGLSAASGRFTSAFRADRAGLYHVRAEARRGTTSLGASDRWIYVGGADREFADPRLNEGFLRRTARDSGGRYVRAADASRVAAWLREAERQQAAPERREVWHAPWVMAVVALLLSSEWALRRRWGLR